MKIPPILQAGARLSLAITLSTFSITAVQAAQVEFTTAEGYTSGTLDYQPTAAPKWRTVLGTTSFTVNPATGVAVNTAQTGSQYAVWQEPTDFTATATRVQFAEFNFTQSAATGGTSAILGLTYLYNATSTTTNVRCNLARQSGTDQYRITFYQNNGSPAVSLAQNVAGSALGLNSAGGDNASDTLRLSFTLTRRSTANSFEGEVKLENVTAGTTPATLAVPAFTTSATLYADTSVYGTLSSEAVQTAALSSLRLSCYGTPSAPGNGMTLTFIDDFNSLDRNKWNPHPSGTGTINSELQAYVPWAILPQPGGIMRIQGLNTPYADKSYISGQLTTDNLFSQTYGYFEMRAKVPAGKGLWPAFWTLGLDRSWPPEIDILEHLGREVNVAHTTLHWKDPVTGNRRSEGNAHYGPDYTLAYHTYGVSWMPDMCVFYIDGVEVYRILGAEKISDTPMFLILNLAMGGSWAQAPNGTTPWPANYDIDWVKAWQYDDAPVVAPLPVSFGRTGPSAEVVAPGQTVTITSKLKAGNAAVTARNNHVFIRNYKGDVTYADLVAATPAIPANGEATFSATWTVPVSAVPGIYTVKLQSGSYYSGYATHFQVQ